MCTDDYLAKYFDALRTIVFIATVLILCICISLKYLCLINYWLGFKNYAIIDRRLNFFGGNHGIEIVIDQILTRILCAGDLFTRWLKRHLERKMSTGSLLSPVSPAVLHVYPDSPQIVYEIGNDCGIDWVIDWNDNWARNSVLVSPTVIKSQNCMHMSIFGRTCGNVKWAKCR